jgi:hypothetical protein
MIPHHNTPEDLHALTEIVKDTLILLSNKRTPTLTPKDKVNFEVASWIPSGNAMTSVSSLLLEDKFGKDGLSSQSTYKDKLLILMPLGYCLKITRPLPTINPKVK